MTSQIYIKSIAISPDIRAERAYFARLPVVQHLLEKGRVPLAQPVTFFAGENGTGKSTLLEAMAVCAGFNPEGGTVNFNFSSRESHSGLYEYLTLVRGVHRPRDGFFLRAESFYNAATELDRLDAIPTYDSQPPLLDSYGGVSLHEQSHGESFLALVLHRFGAGGLYILDEPEAALSPQRQLALLAAIHGLAAQGSQFIISTHSPILLTLPGAAVYQLTQNDLRLCPYQETDHYRMTQSFLNNPEKMLEILLGEKDTGPAQA